MGSGMQSVEVEQESGQVYKMPGHIRFNVGASLLAKNSQAPHSSRKHALSLTFFASKLAPTFIQWLDQRKLMINLINQRA